MTDGTNYTHVKVAHAAACALDDSGFLHCWGEAAADAPTDTPIATFDMEWEHACAVTQEGEAVCWAWLDGFNGVLGTDAHLSSPIGPFSAVATGKGTTCWLTAERTAKCLGDVVSSDAGPPSIQLSRIAGGNGPYCATQAEGDSLVCWGYDTGWFDRLPQSTGLDFDVGDGELCYIDEALQLTCLGLDTQDSDVEVADPWTPTGTYLAVAAANSPCFLGSDGMPDCFYLAFDTCEGMLPGPAHAIGTEHFSGCAALDAGGISCWTEEPGDAGGDPCVYGHPSTLSWRE